MNVGRAVIALRRSAECEENERKKKTTEIGTGAMAFFEITRSLHCILCDYWCAMTRMRSEVSSMSPNALFLSRNRNIYWDLEEVPLKSLSMNCIDLRQSHRQKWQIQRFYLTLWKSRGGGGESRDILWSIMCDIWMGFPALTDSVSIHASSMRRFSSVFCPILLSAPNKTGYFLRWTNL